VGTREIRRGVVTDHVIHRAARHRTRRRHQQARPRRTRGGIRGSPSASRQETGREFVRAARGA